MCDQVILCKFLALVTLQEIRMSLLQRTAWWPLN